MNATKYRWMGLAALLGAAVLQAAPAAAQGYERAYGTDGTHGSAYDAAYGYTPPYFGLPLVVAQGHGHPGRPAFREGGEARGGRGGREPRHMPPPPPPPPPSPPPQYVPPMRGHGGQMSEEERRQFRRDLDKANRELYTPRR